MNEREIKAAASELLELVAKITFVAAELSRLASRLEKVAKANGGNGGN